MRIAINVLLRIRITAKSMMLSFSPYSETMDSARDPCLRIEQYICHRIADKSVHPYTTSFDAVLEAIRIYLVTWLSRRGESIRHKLNLFVLQRHHN
jgi:hypothetical protein